MNYCRLRQSAAALLPALAASAVGGRVNLEVRFALMNLGTLFTPSGVIGRIKMFDPFRFSLILW